MTLENVDKQDNGDYECFLPNGQQEAIQLTVFGRQDDLNSISLDENDAKDALQLVNMLTNELTAVETNSTSNETAPVVALKRYRYNSCQSCQSSSCQSCPTCDSCTSCQSCDESPMRCPQPGKLHWS